MSDAFRICSTCKTPIPFGGSYFTCSVSTCNRKRIGLFFCSVQCWDAHLPEARHRDAWAESQTAPTREQWKKEQAGEDAAETRSSSTSVADAVPKRRMVDTTVSAQPSGIELKPDPGDRDALVVVSKLKKYIKDRSDMNTSQNVVNVLSDHLRELCTEAIRVAAQNERRTVMDRDFAVVLSRYVRR
jgi:hypothetical protein